MLLTRVDDRRLPVFQPVKQANADLIVRPPKDTGARTLADGQRREVKRQVRVTRNSICSAAM